MHAQYAYDIVDKDNEKFLLPFYDKYLVSENINSKCTLQH